MIQFQYSKREFNKIKYLIKKICIDYVASHPSKENLISKHFIENTTFAYILGLIDLEPSELEFIKKTLLQEPVIILIDTREDSFYMFPYFILLFQNSFERRKINVDENSVEELRYFFTNTNTLNIVKKFTEFCKKNNFGVFQLRTKFDTLSGSQGYKRLIKFIDIQIKQYT